MFSHLVIHDPKAKRGEDGFFHLSNTAADAENIAVVLTQTMAQLPTPS